MTPTQAWSRQAGALIRACHAPPAIAVTLLTGALALADDAAPPTMAAVVLAVFSGQLIVGWSNDLIDRDRDKQVGRTDKPLATGELSPRTVIIAITGAAVVCVVSSFACGWAAGTLHLVLGVGSALAYNAYLKSTVLSWLPYFLAFGSLPAIVSLAVDPNSLPPIWMVAVAALLGVGAHLVNALPDLEDDVATGISGLPHRLGADRVPVVSTVLLVGASAIAVIANRSVWWLWPGLVVVVLVAVTTMRMRGRAPFYGAIVIAGIDAAMLVLI